MINIIINFKKGCRLRDTVVLSGSVIGENSWVSESVIGWNCTLGRWVRIEGVSVCGEDVQIKDELFINATFILPHRAVSSSIYNKGTIVM